MTRSMKHYCEVAPMTDYLFELKSRKMDFQGPDLKLQTLDQKPLPTMTQGQFEELGEIVIGAI